MRFLVRLIEQMNLFNHAKALNLSDEIYLAEADGYNLTKREEKYWRELLMQLYMEKKASGAPR